jgi:hypothetical protein
MELDFNLYFSIQIIRHENKELLNRLFLFCVCVREGGWWGGIAIGGPKVGSRGRHELHARPLLSPPSLAHLNYLLALSDVWLRQDNVSLLCMRSYHYYYYYYYYYYCCYSYTDCPTNNVPPRVTGILLAWGLLFATVVQLKSVVGIWDSHSGDCEEFVFWDIAPCSPLKAPPMVSPPYRGGGVWVLLRPRELCWR